MRIPNPNAPTLDALLDVLRDRTQSDELDWTSLPTYGGQDPRDTYGVWSWDATRQIVGVCADDVRIVPRDVTGD